MSWGVTPILVDLKDNSDELFDHAVDQAEREGLISQGEIVVLTAGVPLGVSGTTNLIKVHVAGHILINGKGLTDKSVSANLCVAENAKELKKLFKAGDIIVTSDTNNEMMEQIRMASGLIIESNDSNSHGAIAGLSCMIMALLQTKTAIPMGLYILIALVVAVLCGFINSVIIYDLKVPPMIATL